VSAIVVVEIVVASMLTPSAAETTRLAQDLAAATAGKAAGETDPHAAHDAHAGHGCSQMDGDGARQQDELEVRMQLIRHKVLVLSGKGGVGKSTVAVNLAAALAAAGRRVGLLDVDLHGPSVPSLLGLDYTPVPGRAGGIAPAPVRENLWAMSIQFFLPEDDDAVIWRGPRKYSAIREMLGAVDWGHLDCLVVDAPPGTGDEALALAPMAVVPGRQRQGVGTALIEEALRRAEETGFPLIVVVGHAAYYPRFGFEPAAALGLRAPFDVPPEAWMARRLPAHAPRARGLITYADAFGAV